MGLKWDAVDLGRGEVKIKAGRVSLDGGQRTATDDHKSSASGRTVPVEGIQRGTVALLKALLSVFVADGRFDEREHAALVDYTEAIGFDRKSAPDMLKGLTRDFAKGNIT